MALVVTASSGTARKKSASAWPRLEPTPSEPFVPRIQDLDHWRPEPSEAESRRGQRGMTVPCGVPVTHRGLPCGARGGSEVAAKAARLCGDKAVDGTDVGILVGRPEVGPPSYRVERESLSEIHRSEDVNLRAMTIGPSRSSISAGSRRPTVHPDAGRSRRRGHQGRTVRRRRRDAHLGPSVAGAPPARSLVRPCVRPDQGRIPAPRLLLHRGVWPARIVRSPAWILPHGPGRRRHHERDRRSGPSTT